MGHPVFLDIMFASTCLKGAADVWARAFPTAPRSEAHETLSLLFAQDGVPPACICDNAKKMIKGKFYQKLKDAACHLRQLEPYTPL